MRKASFCLVVIATVTGVGHAERSATLLWETEPGLAAPYSAVYDSVRSVIYVSNRGGAAGEGREGGGYLSKLDTLGTIVVAEWVKGLRTPRGMAIAGENLYVADGAGIVVIGIASGTIRERYGAPEARMLRDITADRNGALYVIDSGSTPGTIYRLLNGRLSVWVREEPIARPGGVCVAAGAIVVGLQESGAVYRISPTREIRQIGRVSSGIRALVGESGGAFFVSTVTGHVLYLSYKEGEIPLLEMPEGNAGPPDIDYVPSRRILLVPKPEHNRVAAYAITF